MDEHSGTLNVSLLVIEEEIAVHLNSAQASLDTMQTKYARNGLLSAARVATLAKLALIHAKFTDAKERARFDQYLELSARLLNSYWEDFGLVLLKSAHTEETVERRMAPKPENGNGNGHPIVKHNGRGRKPQQKMDPGVRAEMIEMLKGGTPDNYEKTAGFLRDVAAMFETSFENVNYAYYGSLGLTAKDRANGH